MCPPQLPPARLPVPRRREAGADQSLRGRGEARGPDRQQHRLHAGAGAADDFSIDRYNAAMQARTQELTPQELLEQYKSIRANAIAWTSSLTDADLEKQGRHPFLGMTTIREMIKMLYIHNLTHYRDIKKVIK